MGGCDIAREWLAPMVSCDSRGRLVAVPTQLTNEHTDRLTD